MLRSGRIAFMAGMIRASLLPTRSSLISRLGHCVSNKTTFIAQPPHKIASSAIWSRGVMDYFDSLLDISCIDEDSTSAPGNLPTGSTDLHSYSCSADFALFTPGPIGALVNQIFLTSSTTGTTTCSE
ncbi:hypothetical protein BC827DRAFT_600557 [Russula dissimulans]|nr:hypothetical protein BC827DRAFT_600557 [Russula dissimulans]